MSQTEIEWQFDAHDLGPVVEWLTDVDGRSIGGGPALTVRAEPQRHLVDQYVDTDDWRLRRAGLVLRTRQNGSGTEVTMKDVRTASSTGLRRRLELTEALEGGTLATLGPNGPVGARVAAVAGQQPLGPVLEIRTRRRPYALMAGGVEVAEVALDDTILVAGKGQRPARLRRVEVEVAPDWIDRLAPVVEDLRAAAGLQPAALSKFESGLLAAGVSMPSPPDLGRTGLGPASTVGEVAYAVLRRNVAQLLAREPGTRLGDDPEELHDMRVAIRRLRAAMSLFADSLPPRARLLRAELRWVGHALGAVRDLDVQLAGLGDLAGWAAQWPEDGDAALRTLERLLEHQREAARRDLLGVLDSPRWSQLGAAMVALAQQGPPERNETAGVPALVALPRLVRHRHRQATRAAKVARRSGAAGDYHQLRIRCKRLRYAAECTADLYGKDAKRFIKELTNLQDALGSNQDAAVAVTKLASLVRRTGGQSVADLPPTTVFALGGLAAHYRERSRQLRAEMGTAGNVLTGRSWKALAAAMAGAQRRQRH
jgi:triphosphatase